MLIGSVPLLKDAIKRYNEFEFICRMFSLLYRAMAVFF